jgi:hypothetical protein
MKTLFPAVVAVILSCIFSFPVFAQVAPAGIGSVQVSPGVYFGFGSEGTFMYGSTFTYLNYNTGEFDSILTSLAANGTFSGTSPTTGRIVTGLVSSSSISMTYLGITAAAPKVSSYGPTGAFAGNWVGLYAYPGEPFGFFHIGVNSQGGAFVTSFLESTEDAGTGTIDAAGNYQVTLLSGQTLTGQFQPIYGRATGYVYNSIGLTGSYVALRAVTSRLLNISTRGTVGTGQNVLIGGFVIGDGGKTVFIDAKGPSLAAFGITNPVQATQISLYFGSEVIASNNGWRNNSNAAEIIASGLQPTNDRESALQVALEPGAYTAIVSSGDGSTGIGLVEIYGVGDTGGP